MVTLPYGRSSVSFDWPSGLDCDLLEYPGASHTVPEVESARRIREALDRPIGTPRLMELAKGKDQAVILISDGTRLCPSPLLLRELLRELNGAGIADDRVDVVVALGLHRKHTETELEALTGPDIFRRVRVHNHSPLTEHCVRIGTTSRGTPVEINRLVAEAPLRIATGNIEPHNLVGISGGVKALIPGVASHACIERNHSLSLEYTTEPGKADNPVHRDLEEALRFISIDYMLNVVVNHRRQVLEAVAGDIQEAHRKGTDLAVRHFLIPAERKYDLVVIAPGGTPKDCQLYQSLKSLRNASGFARPGGTLLMAAECGELFGNGIFQFWVETMHKREEAAAQLKKQFVLGAHKILHADEILSRHNVWLYSSIPPALVELLGFRPVERLQETVTALTERKSLSVAVMPYGALTFPMLSSV
ncbi:nickel-dependent lactate racemase [Paenibacillus filicis]|uniref:Nickel-dependent lactate racemase n=1 Tax=Paenibacillus gyeongsangnamensis TaxID=3388067 RepID=A0ABT4QAM9_9BACL|nr:nickel-dependent lactate racemase [Paenibacillus filicis]MCZ8513898.1 nickel-dependent lactate racemase [Paenibacillus filicis]